MKNRLSLILFFVTLFVGCESVYAQEPSYRVFETQEGLINENVYFAFQDSEGFIWFGTEAGLSRFDGQEFENFTTLDGLSDNEVLSIHEDSQGRIWFLTYSGSPTYWQEGGFHSAKNDPLLADFPLETYLSNFLEDRDGNIWMASDNSGVVKITHDDSLIHYTDHDFIKTIHLFQTTDGSFYAINYHHIQPFTLTGNSVNFGPKNEITTLNNRSILLQSGKVLSAARNGIFELDMEKGTVTRVPIDPPWNGQVISLKQDREGNLWVGTWDGVYRFPESRLTTDKYEHLLPGKAVTSVLVDHEGNYWFTTLGNGVFTTPSPDFHTYQEADGLPANQVTTLAVNPEGQLVMGFPGNKYAFLTDTGIEVHSLPSTQTRDQINAFHWDEEGALWIGADVFLGLIEGDTRYLKRLGTKCLLLDDDTHFWLGGPGRLFLFSQKPFSQTDESWARGLKARDSSLVDFIANFTTFALCKDKQGRIWAGTTRGLFQIVDRKMVPFRHDLPQLSNRIQDLAVTPAGDLLVGTYGQGLVLLKPDTFQVWDQTNGLPGNICKAVSIDNEGQIWVGTDKGLTKIAKEGPKGEYQIVQSFFNQNGLATNVINDVLVHKEQVCVATPNGLTLLPRAQLVQPVAPPFIHLVRFEAGDSVIPPGTSPKIRYRDRNLTFTFRGIHFRSPKKLGYRYRMSGSDKEWHYTQNNQINYLEIPPGTYTFFVQAVLPGDIVSEKTEEVSFQVLAPLWRRLILLEILGALLLIAGAFYLSLKQIKKRERKKAAVDQKIAESELKALQAQMNPHFIFNALNSIQRFILKNDPDAAYHHLERFGALIRMILENSKQKFITLEDELETLRLYLDLESLRFEERFAFQIDISDKLPKHDLRLPPMLLQPYVENAILHGLTPKESPGKLDIRFESDQAYLIVTIEDDGIGREASRELKSRLRRGNRKSTGLVNTAERIRHLNVHDSADYYVEIIDLKGKDQEPLGTRVVVRIPLLLG